MEVTRHECEARQKTCDERFSRDKDRIKDNESKLDQLISLVTTTTSIAQANATAISKQEERLRALEFKPGAWWEKLLTAGIGVLAGYLISLLTKAL